MIGMLSACIQLKLAWTAAQHRGTAVSSFSWDPVHRQTAGTAVRDAVLPWTAVQGQAGPSIAALVANNSQQSI